MKLPVFVFVCLLAVSTSFFSSSDSILLEDVSALTFYSGQQTSSRRSHPIPQLRCVGSECNSAAIPSVVQCKNSGSSGNGNVQWECKAELPEGYRFGRVNVNCEGYNNPNDRYVLRGSCGLEFSLISSGGSGSSWGSSGHQQQYPNTFPSSHYTPLTKGISSTVVFFILIALGAWLCFFRRPHHYSNVGARRGGWRPFGFNSNPQDQCADTTSNNNRPGFWTGMLGGGAMGYLFGRRNANDTYNRTTHTYQTSSPRTSPTERTHESTGYGGTTRR
jgi:hypothetical protein